MALTTITAALDLISKSSKALDSVREQAKSSHDAVLKENILGLYDHFLDLKAIVLRLTEENAALRQSMAAQAVKPPKPEIRQVGETNYYYVGDQGPYCQKCYDGNNGKLVNLMPRQDYAGGPGRKCEVCETVFFESRRPQGGQIKPYSPYG
jgi:hypothetical protein